MNSQPLGTWVVMPNSMDIKYASGLRQGCCFDNDSRWVVETLGPSPVACQRFARAALGDPGKSGHGVSFQTPAPETEARWTWWNKMKQESQVNRTPICLTRTTYAECLNAPGACFGIRRRTALSIETTCEQLSDAHSKVCPVLSMQYLHKFAHIINTSLYYLHNIVYMCHLLCICRCCIFSRNGLECQTCAILSEQVCVAISCCFCIFLYLFVLFCDVLCRIIYINYCIW